MSHVRRTVNAHLPEETAGARRTARRHHQVGVAARTSDAHRYGVHITLCASRLIEWLRSGRGPGPKGVRSGVCQTRARCLSVSPAVGRSRPAMLRRAVRPGAGAGDKHDAGCRVAAEGCVMLAPSRRDHTYGIHALASAPSSSRVWSSGPCKRVSCSTSSRRYRRMRLMP